MQYITMKIFLLFAVITLGFSFAHCFAQLKPICADKYIQNIQFTGLNHQKEVSNRCEEDINIEANTKIQNLLSICGFFLDIKVCRRDNIQNALAYLDRDGTRYILYDNEFLRSLDSDSMSFETRTIFAHEIGHHLAGHALSLNNDDYRKAYGKYCQVKSPQFDRKTCAAEGRKYLEISRVQEIQADRFAGYIMFKFGASLDKILNVYYQFPETFDDNTSTHPPINSRIEAVKVGFELARNDSMNGTAPNIEVVKGGSYQLSIKDFSRVERNKLLDSIRISCGGLATDLLRAKSSVDGFAYNSSVPNTYDSVVKNYVKCHDTLQYDTDTSFFQLSCISWQLRYDQSCFWEQPFGIQIQNDSLVVLLFNPDELPRVVYKSRFNHHEINLNILKSSFVEIYTNRTTRALDDYNRTRRKKR